MMARREFIKMSALAGTAVASAGAVRLSQERPYRIRPDFDAHVHVWERPWQNFIVGTWRKGMYAQRDLVLALMDRYGIQRACVLAACDQTHPRNNEFVAKICRAHKDRFFMFSEIPLLSKKKEELLERTLNDWPAVGVRYVAAMNESPRAWMGPEHARFWDKVSAAGLFFALNLGPSQSAQLGPLINAYPRIRWLIDHMGRPRHNLTDAEYKPVLDLAGFANTFIKISGFYAFTNAGGGYPYSDLARFVQKLRQTYGPQRMLWGSDIPPVLDYSSLEQTFNCLFSPEMGLSDEDLKWILGGAAAMLFGEQSQVKGSQNNPLCRVSGAAPSHEP